MKPASATLSEAKRQGHTDGWRQRLILIEKQLNFALRLRRAWVGHDVQKQPRSEVEVEVNTLALTHVTAGGTCCVIPDVLDVQALRGHFFEPPFDSVLRLLQACALHRMQTDEEPDFEAGVAYWDSVEASNVRASFSDVDLCGLSTLTLLSDDSLCFYLAILVLVWSRTAC